MDKIKKYTPEFMHAVQGIANEIAQKCILFPELRETRASPFTASFGHEFSTVIPLHGEAKKLPYTLYIATQCENKRSKKYDLEKYNGLVSYSPAGIQRGFKIRFDIETSDAGVVPITANFRFNYIPE